MGSIIQTLIPSRPGVVVPRDLAFLILLCEVVFSEVVLLSRLLLAPGYEGKILMDIVDLLGAIGGTEADSVSDELRLFVVYLEEEIRYDLLHLLLLFSLICLLLVDVDRCDTIWNIKPYYIVADIANIVHLDLFDLAQELPLLESWCYQ
jgi:hypothetical protein